MRLITITPDVAKEMLFDLKNEGVLCLNTGEAKNITQIEFYDLELTDVRRAAVLLNNKENMFFTRDENEA